MIAGLGNSDETGWKLLPDTSSSAEKFKKQMGSKHIHTELAMGRNMDSVTSLTLSKAAADDQAKSSHRLTNIKNKVLADVLE